VSESGIQHMYDAFDHDVRILMLPDTNHGPAIRLEFLVGVVISLTIRENLLPPPLGVGLWPGAMDRTAMPEATVQKDCDVQGWECDVRSNPLSSFRCKPCRWRADLRASSRALSRPHVAAMRLLVLGATRKFEIAIGVIAG
jgi:hypothetical protein